MTLRERLETLIEDAIALLDQIDGDAEREDDGTAEPWLGWTPGMGIGDRNDLEIAEADHAA